jgi:hypothetical protein
MWPELLKVVLLALSIYGADAYLLGQWFPEQLAPLGSGHRQARGIKNRNLVPLPWWRPKEADGVRSEVCQFEGWKIKHSGRTDTDEDLGSAAGDACAQAIGGFPPEIPRTVAAGRTLEGLAGGSGQVVKRTQG